MVNTALSCFDVTLMRWAADGQDQYLAPLVDEVLGFVQIPHAPSNA